MFLCNIKSSAILVTSMLYICTLFQICATPLVSGVRAKLVNIIIQGVGIHGTTVFLYVLHAGFNWGFYLLFATLMMYDKARLKNVYPYKIIENKTLSYVALYTLGDVFITGYQPASFVGMLENLFGVFIIMAFIDFLFSKYKLWASFNYQTLLEKDYCFYMIAVMVMRYIDNPVLYASALTVIIVFFGMAIGQLKELMSPVSQRSIPLYMFLSILTIYKYMIVLLIILSKKI